MFFLNLNNFKKFRNIVISSSQWNLSVVGIYWVMWGNRFRPRKHLIFWILNFVFPLLFFKKSFYFTFFVPLTIQGEITLPIGKKTLLFLDTDGLSYWWCNHKRIPHKNSVCLFGRKRLCILKQQLVLSKIILCMELRVLINLDSHWES